MSAQFSEREYFVGPIALLAVSIAHNLAASRMGKPTISMSVRWMSQKHLGAWITGAVIGGLIAHWFLDLEESDGA